MIRNALVAVLVVSLLTIRSAQAQSGKPTAAAPPKGDVAAIQKLVTDMNAAWERKDAAWFEANTAHDADMVNFGTDAAEVWVGWAPYFDAAKKQLAALESIKAKLRDVRVKVHAPGKVASVTYFGDFEGTSGGQKFAVQGMRVLNVLEKRNGRWLFTSGHASMPVAGQVVKY